MNTTSAPPAAKTESESLRTLNLPTTKRQWLRSQLPSVEVGGGRIYEARAVDELRLRMDAARLTNRAVQAEPYKTALHTR